jgi:hypothetical protein
MKTTAALLCAITLLSSTARADWTSAAPYRYDRSLVNDDDAQSARAMKISGAVLTAVGAALQITAVVLGVLDNWVRRFLYEPQLGTMSFAAIGLGVGGTALAASGIPLLAIGARRLRRIERAGGVTASGPLSLTVRF